MDDERRTLLENLEEKQRRYRREFEPFGRLPEPDMPSQMPEGEPLHRPLPPGDLCKRQS